MAQLGAGALAGLRTRRIQIAQLQSDQAAACEFFGCFPHAALLRQYTRGFPGPVADGRSAARSIEGNWGAYSRFDKRGHTLMAAACATENDAPGAEFVRTLMVTRDQNMMPADVPQLRHWWVNHPDSDGAQVDGGYLWLPKKNKNGSRTPSQHNMTRLMPGDIVFSCTGGTVAAIGVVLECARSAPISRALAALVRPRATEEGWLVPVRFVQLARPLRPSQRAAEIKPLLPHRQSPLRVCGDANPTVILAEVPARLAELLRRMLERQVEECEARIAMEMDGKLAERAIGEHIWQRSDIGLSERRQLLSARVGQGVFRDRVERTESGCRVTGILDRRYLRATHLKPWKDADDREKLDGFNGLLLAPHIQQLFDRGQISFADDGTLLISRHLNPYVRKAWGLEQPLAPRAFMPEQRVYLDYHRQQVFEKVGGGRRSVAGNQPAQDRTAR